MPKALAVEESNHSCALCQRYGDQELDAVCIMTNMDHLHISLIFHVAKISKVNNASRFSGFSSYAFGEQHLLLLFQTKSSVIFHWKCEDLLQPGDSVEMYIYFWNWYPMATEIRGKGFFCLFVFLLQQNKTSSNHWTTVLLLLKVTLSLPIIANIGNTHYILKTVKHVGSKFTKQ